MDINSLNSGYAQYLSSSVSATGKTNSMKNLDTANATDEELMDACKQFEEYLVEMVMKEVLKTVDVFGTGKGSSAAMSTRQDMMKDQMVQDLAAKVTENANLGVAQQLYESMKRNMP